MVQVGRTRRDLCGSLFLRVQWLDCIDVVGVYIVCIYVGCVYIGCVYIVASKINDCPFLTTHVGALVRSFERLGEGWEYKK